MSRVLDELRAHYPALDRQLNREHAERAERNRAAQAAHVQAFHEAEDAREEAAKQSRRLGLAVVPTAALIGRDRDLRRITDGLTPDEAAGRAEWSPDAYIRQDRPMEMVPVRNPHPDIGPGRVQVPMSGPRSREIIAPDTGAIIRRPVDP